MDIPKTISMRIAMLAKKDKKVSDLCASFISEKYNPDVKDFWGNVSVWLKYVAKGLELQSALKNEYGIEEEFNWGEFDKYPHCTIAEGALRQYTKAIFINDFKELSAKCRQLSYRNEFGEIEREDFINYLVGKYINSRVEAPLRAFKQFLTDYCDKEWVIALDMSELYRENIMMVLDIVREDASACENEPDDPYEYEKIVAHQLCELGWTAYSTSGSGDQGADVVAEKYGLRFVIQCKLYSQPVGNKAVQEVSSARDYYEAFGAAVVTNNDYTKSAKQLAESQDVWLLHDSMLDEWSYAVDQMIEALDGED
ncbi:restriction endonuclease [Pseudoalteromonas sp. YIC-827]|uniref:Restriction endonuclease n=1 Tax=Pseudoalteromonas qingdaonensis TaxID=3131913 RepID=A0ABU9N0E7_9GAMM